MCACMCARTCNARRSHPCNRTTPPKNYKQKTPAEQNTLPMHHMLHLTQSTIRRLPTNMVKIKGNGNRDAHTR